MKLPKLSKDEQTKRDKEIFKAPRGTPGAEPGTLSWCYQTVSLLGIYWQDKVLSEQDWLKILNELKDHEVWNKIPPEKPYGSLDALLKAEVGVVEDEIVSECRKARENPSPIQEIGKGKAGPGRGNKTGDNVTRFNESKRGNSKEYQLSVMARDFPETLDKLEAGEYKSARQAAIACGIVKVKPPLDVALTAYNKLSDDEKKAFLEQINA